MNDIAISVENLSKRYRIGVREKMHDTLTGALTSWVKSPLHNYRQLRNLTKFDSEEQAGDVLWALKDVSFQVKHGEVIGIVGRNGAGKSTLLKVLSRITEPSHGRVRLNGRIASLLEVGTGFHPELTGRENVYLNGTLLGMTKAEVERKFDEIVSFSGVEKFIDTPVKRYSSGMQVRLAFSVAAHLEPEILLIDEVLAVGDTEFQKRCLGKMNQVANEGRTVLFVSHNMAAVENLCSRGVLLHQGSVVLVGSIREVISTYLGERQVNEATFSGGPVRSVAVAQLEDRLEIRASYDTEHPLRLPKLGFVISDIFGTPIMGANPQISGLAYQTEPHTSGTVSVVVREPKLLNGTYRLSVWFGDSTADFFTQRDLLTFDIINMAPLSQRAPRENGPVFPVCDWTFSPDLAVDADYGFAAKYGKNP